MKVGLIVATYNRPEYLKECLESIKRAKVPDNVSVLIIDDASTNEETLRLISDFNIPGIFVTKFFKKHNLSIKDTMLMGGEYLFYELKCDIVINLDSDAVISNDFFERLLFLKARFNNHIITGFNCLTRNNDGSERHKVLMSGEGFNLKKSVGGINMLFDKDQFKIWVKPALQRSIENNLNWDHQTCIASMRDSFEIVCAVPSVVQHIGFTSSMGHATRERPDTADDFKAVRLPNVTLIAVDDNVEGIIKAADISCRDIEFGAVKLLSCSPSSDKRVVPIRKLGSKKEYSIFMMKEVVDYIDTPYFITIQADGYILNGCAFNESWYRYDFIGAPWHWYKDGHNVGNGGMSFRTRRLHQILKEDGKIFPTNDSIISEFQEDHNIARIYRKYLETNHDINFAPIKVAERFSIEAWSVKPPGNKYTGQFGFHGKHTDFSGSNLSHKPY